MLLMLLVLLMKTGSVTAWSVTFENQSPCALEGSSVVFRCSYSYPDGETVQDTGWYKGEVRNYVWTRVKLSDIASNEGRVQYLGDQQDNCSLAIDELEPTDAGHYYFRFTTDKYGRRSKKSVFLSLTKLSARANPATVRAGHNVTLECETSCQLSDKVWFKDGRPIAKTEFKAQMDDAGRYSCTTKGWEWMQSDPVTLDVQYPPLNVSIEASHSGQVSVGSLVNLTCSSAANPAAHSFTWYKHIMSANSSSLLQVGSGLVLSLQPMEASHAGLYFCQARNPLGESMSAEVLLTVVSKDINKLILLMGIGVKIGLVLLLLLLTILVWRRRCHSTVDEEDDCHTYENIFANYTSR